MNNKRLDRLISKSLKETLEEKANNLASRLKSNINELGNLNFADMSSEDIENLLRSKYGKKDFKPYRKHQNDWEEIVGSDDETIRPRKDFRDEMEEGFDDHRMKRFRDNEDYSEKEFESIPLGKDEIGFDYERLDDDTGVEPKRRFFNDFKRAFRDMGHSEFGEGKEDACECGGMMKEGECEECGYKMEGVYEFDDIDNEENKFDYTEEEMYEQEDIDFEDEDVSKDDRVEKFCSKNSPDYDETACEYHKKQSGEMTEKLHGNQRRLDKNRNGKLDSADFRMLRSMKSKKTETDEEVEEGNAFTGALAKAKEEGDDDFSVGGKKFHVRENKKRNTKGLVKLTESEMIELIEGVILEQKLKSKGGKPRGLQKYQQAHEKSGKINKENITNVGKKMKDYLKDGSKGDFEMNPKHFPKGNGELAKMKTKKYVMSKDGDEFLNSYMRPGMEDLVPEEINYDENWVSDNIKGSSRTGNNPEWANAEKTELGSKIDKKRKDKKFHKAKMSAYRKSKQPISDGTGENSGDGINIKLESQTKNESKKLNEEFDKIKGLIGYNRKTQ